MPEPGALQLLARNVRDARRRLDAFEARSPAPWRRGAWVRKPEPWELDILRFVCEQGAIPLDQLSRFSGRDEQNTESLAEKLCDAGFVYHRRFFEAEPAWVWLTSSTVSLLQTRLGLYRPKLGGLARLRAINEIRLRLDSPEAGLRWFGWRELRRELNGRGRIPIAVVEVGVERHAIELEMRHKKPAQMTSMVEHRSAHYDAVVCFCTRRPRRLLERLAAEHHWPKLIIRDLPGGDPRPRLRQPFPG